MPMLEQLAQQVGARLIQRGWWIGAAESCTGGLLISTLTDVPGSSRYVAGGIISYSNALKQALLGVYESTLAAYGAVSEPTAHEMALGALRRLNVDIALSVTGIAGPSGGTPEKPVGLVYIGAALRESNAERVVVRRFQWKGTREQNKRDSVRAALALVLELLPDHPNVV
ncbi:MAG: CinA family protein [Anaerolineae bacterium]